MERTQIRPVELAGTRGSTFAALHLLGRETVALIICGLRLSRSVSR